MDEYVEKMERKQRSKRRFRNFLLIWCLTILVLGAVVCAVLYKYCESYEASLPERVMETLMSSTTEDQWLEYGLTRGDFTAGEFEDTDALYEQFSKSIQAGGEITYRKDAKNYTDDTPTYTVRVGGQNLCCVSLVPDGENAAGFGRQLWKVGSIISCFSEEGLDSMTVEVYALEGAKFYINDIEVSDEYLTDETVACEDLTELEQQFAEAPEYVVYRVSPMYGEIKVTDQLGNEMTPEISGSVVRYTMEGDNLYSFAIRAPEDVTVSVCGVELTEDYITETTLGALEELEYYTKEDAYENYWYRYEGLYTKPDITAVDADGNSLTPLINEKGEMYFFYSDDEALKEQYKSYVEYFFNAYVDYSAKAYNDYTYQILLGCILKGTDLYNYVRDSVDAMIWASATEVTYDELSFENFHKVNDNCFTCTVRYKGDFSAQAWYESYSYDMENAYEVSFVQVDGVWFASAMSVVAG